MFETDSTCKRKYNDKICNGKLKFKYKLPDLDKTRIYECSICHEETELI